MNSEYEGLIKQAKQLVARLERISADSIWAHRSSGYRGSLLRWIERYERSRQDPNKSVVGEGNGERLFSLIQASTELLENAARDLIK